jgi:pimeloyl-ACP methyl ester carboxylesterase
LTDRDKNAGAAVRAINIGGCFAWFHGATAIPKNTGVVLCPGLKFDDVNGYRALRLLANSLAEHNYPTLRLHYLGTGNSSDPTDQSNLWRDWQVDIHNAANWLRMHHGVNHIVLCGVRFGAALAVSVAEQRPDVVGLLLLAPVLRGRSYIRQLTMEARTPADEWIEIGRVRLSPEATAQIRAFEVRKAKLSRSCKVVMFAQASAARSECAAALASSGIEATADDLGDLTPILRPTFTNHQQPIVVDPIISWLEQSVPGNVTSPVDDLAAEPIEIPTTDGVEVSMRFGANDSLFGILCRPHNAESHTIVLIGNSSADPHSAGVIVDVARYLARSGVASLRFDFSGVGDSGAGSGPGTHVYEIDRSPDFAAALDALSGAYDRFVVYGVCSGAYHAYRAARAETRISAAVLINLPLWEWIPGFPIEELILDVRKPKDYLAIMKTRAFWLGLQYKVWHGGLNVRQRLGWIERKMRHAPGRNRNKTDIATLAQRVKMLFLVSLGDASAELLKREMGLHLSNIYIKFVPELDHAITQHAMRRIVAGHIAAFLELDELRKLPSPRRSPQRWDLETGMVQSGIAQPSPAPLQNLPCP